MNVHYDETTGQIMSYGYGADHGDGFETSHFEGCKVLIVDNQPIDARTQRVDPVTLAIVAKETPDPEPDAMWRVRAAVRQELVDTDYLFLPHAPIDEADLAAWIAYRKALRDSSKGRTTPADVLAAIPARPDGADAFEWLRSRLAAPAA
ncbi:phage tail assembly chaperone [Bradyrhizobium barranii subsp. barranii]|uniref:Phage tail assembly chaperone n=1 Tax=Bradyrhizobium barranii subsp. barranii TaxID=2823807 RepID=A0A7Z0TWR8_9BRAD|nr:phage tail assembly chaperone [Bradyrhizobium barranii]UGX98223.1 phage tail assembly chaperone [Bradyrhizobium barranii subsp. barranii]